jgi:ribosomal protein L29
MILDEIFEELKPSDMPTYLRRQQGRPDLTMRDIEKERPQGAFRFRVGDNEFMDQQAAQEFARGTGDRVEPISQQSQGNQPQNRPQTHRVVDPRSNRSNASFANQQDAQAYARKVNGRVEPIREAQKKNLESRIQQIQKALAEYRVKKKTEEPQDNFTADDIKRLETISDLETLKAQAKQLIKGKPARRMKPEKIAYFYDRVDGLPNRLAVIKMMYDLLLAGEGHKVLGTRHSMDPNVYQRRFGEALAVSRDQDENIILGEAGKDACYNKVRSRYKVWPSAYASGALVQCRKKGAANWGTGGKKK